MSSLLKTLNTVRTQIPSTFLATRAYATKQKKKSKVDPNAVTLDSALPVLKAYAVGCPSHKIEAHIQCFPEKGQPPIRGSCVLPHGLQDNITIAVFAEGQKAQEAKEAGAHIVGGQDLIDKVKNGTVKFDKCLATPDILPSVAKVARILGPRGLMPTVNKGTVVDDVAGAVRYSLQSFDFKADKNNVVHSGFAKISFSAEQTLENIKSLMKVVRSHSKGGKKGFIGTVHLSTTRGPGILIKDV